MDRPASPCHPVGEGQSVALLYEGSISFLVRKDSVGPAGSPNHASRPLGGFPHPPREIKSESP